MYRVVCRNYLGRYTTPVYVRECDPNGRYSGFRLTEKPHKCEPVSLKCAADILSLIRLKAIYGEQWELEEAGPCTESA